MTDYSDAMNDVWTDFGRLFESDFASMNKRLNRMFEDLTNTPGVKTYGYTMYQGPDGIPHVQEFGNTTKDGGLIASTPFGMIAEPLTDVVIDNNVVRATAEIPGVKKEDIVLDGTPSSLTISVNTDRRRFSKTLALPCDVDIGSAKATYNNGILEVTPNPIRPMEHKTKITVE